MLKTAVVRKGKTDMSHKGELQTLIKLSMKDHVCTRETCRMIILESIITMLMSGGRSNCGVTYYVGVGQIWVNLHIIQIHMHFRWIDFN